MWGHARAGLGGEGGRPAGRSEGCAWRSCSSQGSCRGNCWLQGFRTPFLAFDPQQREILYQNGFRYDSTIRRAAPAAAAVLLLPPCPECRHA